MKEYYNEVVDAETFGKLRDKKQFEYRMPVRRRYMKFIPSKGFMISDDECLLAEGPKVIRFRKRWSLQAVELKVRIATIVNEDNKEPYMKLHLV